MELQVDIYVNMKIYMEIYLQCLLDILNISVPQIKTSDVWLGARRENCRSVGDVFKAVEPRKSSTTAGITLD